MIISQKTNHLSPTVFSASRHAVGSASLGGIAAMMTDITSFLGRTRADHSISMNGPNSLLSSSEPKRKVGSYIPFCG